MQADKPIKLEAGKYYRTRDGRKVGPMKDYIRGESFIEVPGDGRWWELDGTGKNMAEGFDLISEWVDEPTRAEADRLTPAQLRFRAWVKREIARWSSLDNTTHTLLMDEAESLEEEAARREAEGKPQSAATGHYENDCEELGRTGVGQDSARPLPQGECEGPGSAAAPKYVATDAVLGAGQIRTATTEKANSAAAEIKAALTGTTPDNGAVVFVDGHRYVYSPEDKPAPADDLVKRLREAKFFNAFDGQAVAREAADRIEAQAWGIAELKRLANSRLEFANQYAAQLGEAEARVRELEAETKLNGELVDSAQEHARNARVKYLAEKARADGLAAAIDRAVEELDAIEKAASANDPWDELQVRAADTSKKLRIDAALTEGGA